MGKKQAINNQTNNKQRAKHVKQSETQHKHETINHNNKQHANKHNQTRKTIRNNRHMYRH